MRKFVSIFAALSLLATPALAQAPAPIPTVNLTALSKVVELCDKVQTAYDANPDITIGTYIYALDTALQKQGVEDGTRIGIVGTCIAYSAGVSRGRKFP